MRRKRKFLQDTVKWRKNIIRFAPHSANDKNMCVCSAKWPKHKRLVGNTPPSPPCPKLDIEGKGKNYFSADLSGFVPGTARYFPRNSKIYGHQGDGVSSVSAHFNVSICRVCQLTQYIVVVCASTTNNVVIRCVVDEPAGNGRSASRQQFGKRVRSRKWQSRESSHLASIESNLRVNIQK